jgi:trans-AT polyketide synthase/acyltransferase/oxidoreductase domain-containing protein
MNESAVSNVGASFDALCYLTVEPSFQADALSIAAQNFRNPVFVIQSPTTGAIGVAFEGVNLQPVAGSAQYKMLGWLPALYPEWLGDRTFNEVHGTRFPYVTGAMANGIATTRIVIEMSRNGFLGFFGAAGLNVDQIEKAVLELKAQLGDTTPWGCNLIHSPSEPTVEAATADLYIREGVRRVEAAAFMSLTPSIVRYAITGLGLDAAGNITRKNQVFAKISRAEVARKFLEPAPRNIVQKLLDGGLITAQEAELSAHVAIAEDIIVESDSGGHTDNRPLTVLFPIIMQLRDQIAQEQGYRRAIRVGAAGGIGVPSAAAAAFAMGAAFVLTGTVNQACVESGLDASGKDMLAKADMADVMMAPAADMFEMGVDVQVLKRGTMFASRARKLYDLYRTYPSLDAIPADQREQTESKILRQTFREAWQATRDYWIARDPHEVERAESDPKHQMALVFRAYLGQSSRWAINGMNDRASDFQIWCGPAMGAFNTWTQGTFLEQPENRTVVQVARNLMEGAGVATRAQQLRTFGAPVPTQAFEFKPRPLT